MYLESIIDIYLYLSILLFELFSFVLIIAKIESKLDRKAKSGR